MNHMTQLIKQNGPKKKLKNDGDVDDNAKHDNLIATELPTCLGSDNILYIKRQIHNY